MPSPKRRPVAVGSFPSTDFYAGFSTEFARAVAERLRDEGVRTAVDPFVGCGTAAVELARAGIHVRGFDLHPVQVLYARAKCTATPEDYQESLGLLRSARPGRAISHSDPLSAWFDPPAVTLFRRAQCALLRECVTGDRTPGWESVDEIREGRELAGHILLFSAARWLVRQDPASNPTWFRPRGNEGLRSVSGEEWSAALDAGAASAGRATSAIPGALLEIARGSALSLPLRTGSVDVIFTSPPYCTRLDYVKATLPELAVLGAPLQDGLRDLRLAMMGTVLMRSTGTKDPRLPPAATGVIASISAHSSKDSGGYYVKFFRQYLLDLVRFASECRRVLASRGRVVLVLQDSYYKDLHVPLAGLAEQIFTEQGFAARGIVAFTARRTWQHLNPASRRYRSASAQPRESVLWLEKEA